MKKQLILAFLICTATSAYADDIVGVSINTSTINGTTGTIDLQFNPSGLGSQAATVKILSFSGATYIGGTQSDLGSVSGGPLPSTVTINDSSAGMGINDDFEGLTFGEIITLTLDFSGAAVSTPNGSSSPSTFYLSLFSDQNGTIPVLTTNPNGNLATVSINPNTGLAVPTGLSPNVSFTPEPGSFALLGAGLLGLGAWVRRRR